MRIIRVLVAPLRSGRTYLRWIYLVLGGVLFVPFLVATLVLVSLLFSRDVNPETSGYGVPGLTAVVLAALLGAATAQIPGVRGQQAQLSRSLLGGRLATEPNIQQGTHGPRLRPGGWLALHLVVGFGVSLLTMVGLTESATLAMTPLTGGDSDTILVDGAWFSGGWRWIGPLAGVAVLVALVYVVAALGAGAARLAPLFLGPSAADRLAAAQAHAAELTERNRIAAELHDSIGHVLSVVALQAGAATRVIDHDPEFARTALEEIAEQARTATAELDHVLGALRQEETATAPQRTLDDLAELVAAARAAGADVRVDQTGELGSVPGVLSRELYRICQEAITNALRHGGAGATISVELHATRERVLLRVSNPAPAHRATRSRGGRGMRSMRERVRLLGGEMEARAHDGEWRLTVTIPRKGR
ncbi:sensor histidine kinase [Halostreptopolyspora alba]|uniref:histidine kinase n=1 Tax=Halostreptopolyspora alba TaxID=2487137 RepID=A0A3N0DYE6_9ACTN|nr:two-component sensor histidine kinase [Nocardiopsaceae bacterium YIM 96095]